MLVESINPWSLAHSQTAFAPITQIVDIGGTSLVSFVLLYCCVSVGNILSRLWRPRNADEPARWGETGLALGLVAVTLVHGLFQIPAYDHRQGDRTLNLGVLQIDPSYNDAISKMRPHSDSLEEEIDLFLWPESTLGSYLDSVTVTNRYPTVPKIRRSLPKSESSLATKT